MLYVGRGILTLQDIRYKGTKYLDEILRAFDGGQAKEGEAGLVPPPNESYQDYVWRKKHIHKVSVRTYSNSVFTAIHIVGRRVSVCICRVAEGCTAILSE